MSAFQTGPTAEDGGFLHRIKMPRPEPPRFHCPECNIHLASETALAEHRFLTHPKPLPRLIIDRIPLSDHGPPVEVNAPIQADRIRVDDTVSARVGGDDVTPDDLPAFLAKLDAGVHEITLTNDHAERRYRFRLQIADDADLDTVDAALLYYITNPESTSADRDAFVKKAREASTAARYLSGVHHYLTGRNAKDGLEDTNLRFDQYREEYNLAGEILSHFDRPVARVICSLIRLHLNLFDQVAGMIPGSSTDASATYFLKHTESLPISHSSDKSDIRNLENALADKDLKTFLSWFNGSNTDRKHILHEAVKAMRSFTAEFDKAKATLVAADLDPDATRDPTSLETLRRLRKHPQFADFFTQPDTPGSLRSGIHDHES